MLLRIIKYDMVRRGPLYAATILTVLVLNIVAISIWGVGGSIAVISILPMGIPAFFLAEVCSAYSREISGKSRYMLFMTPSSGYKIIIAKLISLLIIGISLWAFYAIIFYPNSIYISKELDVYTKIFPDVIKWLKTVETSQLIYIVCHAFLGVIGFILCVFTAQTLQTTFLSRLRFSKLFALFIFLILLYIAGFCFEKIGTFVEDTMLNYDFYVQSSFMRRTTLWGIPMMIIESIGAAILVTFNGYLLERRINL